MLSYFVIIKIIEYCITYFERKDEIPYHAHPLLHEAFDFHNSGTGVWLKSEEPVQGCRHLIRDTADNRVWKAASVNLHDLYLDNELSDPVIVAFNCRKASCTAITRSCGWVVNLSDQFHVEPNKDLVARLFYDRNKSVYEYKKTVGPLVTLFYGKQLPRVLCEKILTFLC